MNFEEYKAWREDVLSSGYILSENRFDCLNPFKAMEFTRKWQVPANVEGATIEDAFRLWKSVHLPSVDGVRWTKIHSEPTRGVRSALGVLFKRMEDEGMELWLPEDVYPFYLTEARAKAPNLAIRHFSTIPQIDVAALDAASGNAVVLVTDPLTPTGRRQTDYESIMLREWSAASPGRWIVKDCVYSYETRVPTYELASISTGRVLHLYSMSKSWLLRGVFGAIIGPTSLGDWWKNIDLEPTQEACASAIEALTHDVEMPINQAGVFDAEWNRRRHKLEKYGLASLGFGSTYFRSLPVNFEKALKEDGLLLVPASVFGSRTMEWSVATCLYEASANWRLLSTWAESE